jgi:pyruvate dehydrogenase E2 component (dihydrolipoamide acetyltransferase)
MSLEITMPKLSDTMEEGTILAWRIKEGDSVARGDIIAEVETDKAAMEMEAFSAGTVTELRVTAGETVKVGTVLAVLAAEGETPEPAAKPEPTVAPEPAATPEPTAAEPEVVAEPEPEPEPQRLTTTAEPTSAGGTPSHREGLAVSPAARRLARERGVSLELLKGSGPGGRVVLADVERAAGKKPQRETPPPGAEAEPRRKSVKIRRIVGRKMVESWTQAPHFFVTVAVDMTDVIRFRQDLSVSINSFILMALARSLHEHPWVNSHWIDGAAAEQPQINIALAVATDRGLYNPVIKDCEALSLKEMNARARDLAEQARLGTLSADDLEGGTFTLSNMGMLGVESFSAIITPPQAAVLAVGTVKGEVVVNEQGEPGIAPVMRMTLSADHRILDGADAAEFLATVKSYLEAPVTLLTCDCR